MTDESSTGIKLETWLLVGFIVAMLLSTTVIMITSSDKTTVYSAYVTDEEQNVQYQQVSSMRSSLGDGGMDYVVANTMSTPMLVNDWRNMPEPWLLWFNTGILVISSIVFHQATKYAKKEMDCSELGG